jgi:hypothetical protein
MLDVDHADDLAYFRSNLVSAKMISTQNYHLLIIWLAHACINFFLQTNN